MTLRKREFGLLSLTVLCLVSVKTHQGFSQDWPQWGGSSLRNNTPEGTGIPTEWNAGKIDRNTREWVKDTAKNIKWVAKLGSQSYGNPVVADGRIYVGTNNSAGYLKRYPSDIDIGCLLCFRETDGKFLWQYSSEKLVTGRVHDWPWQGIVSAPLVEGTRLWFVNNRGEVVCADTEGFYDGNDDGPQQGVRGRLFTIVPELKLDLNWSGRRPARLLLRLLAQQGGLQLPSYFRINPIGESSAILFTGSVKSPRRIARVDFGDETTKISKIVSTADEEKLEEVHTVATNLIAGINNGNLSPTLRFMFKRAGVELTDEVEITTIKPNQVWNVRVKKDEFVNEMQLEISDGNLIAYKLVANDKHEADVVWTFDMMKQLGVRQHNLSTCTITAWNDTIFVCTSNGVDESHHNIPAPEAPSFIAMNKHTGKLLWTDNSPGENILHGQWSAPAVGVLGGVPQVIFCGGDGWVYSFRADRWRKDRSPELLWRFDANPKESEWILGGRGTRNNLVAIPVIHEELVYVVVGQDPEHGEGTGHLWCIDPTKRGDVSPELVFDSDGKLVPHRRHQAANVWEKVFQANEMVWTGLDEGQVSDQLRRRFHRAEMTLSDDCQVKTIHPNSEWLVTANVGDGEELFKLNATSRSSRGQHFYSLMVRRRADESVKPNPNSAVVWHYDRVDRDKNGKIDFEEEFHRGISSVAIKDGLLVVPDFSGLVHCLDAKTGNVHWTCDMLAACWGSPLIVEDNVYIGDEDGDVSVFKLSSDWTKSAKQSEVQRRDGSTSTFNEPIREMHMPSSVYSTPIVANNVLYIADRNHLYAIAATEEE